MNERELKDRTKLFALRVIRLVNSLPVKPAGKVIGNQLLRAATSVSANYRAACRARSKPEFISRLGIVEEEADECCLWLELVIESGLMEQKFVSELLKEANELTAIMASSRISAKRKQDAIANRQSPIAN